MKRYYTTEELVDQARAERNRAIATTCLLLALLAGASYLLAYFLH